MKYHINILIFFTLQEFFGFFNFPLNKWLNFVSFSVMYYQIGSLSFPRVSVLVFILLSTNDYDCVYAGVLFLAKGKIIPSHRLIV